MTLLPPVAAAQAGRASGGGLTDMLSGILGGNKGAAGQAPKGDGSVGLFDGVMMKALMGGVVGAGAGFLPFIPGGPILGGIVGAIAGAGYGVFKNWREMQKIKQENAAFLGQLGVQLGDPAQQAALLAGQPQQLLVGQTAQTGLPAQGSGGTQLPPAAAVNQTVPAQTAQVPKSATAEFSSSGSPVIFETASGPLQFTEFGTTPAQQAGATMQQTGQAAPPTIIDATTQPVSQGAAAIAPKQAELAVGGGSGAPDAPAPPKADPLQAQREEAKIVQQELAETRQKAEQASEQVAEQRAEQRELEAQAKRRQERIARIWTDADPQQRAAMLERLEQRIAELEALHDSLQATQSKAA